MAMRTYSGSTSELVPEIIFLDEEDRALIERRRGEHMKLGFALQLVTVQIGRAHV